MKDLGMLGVLYGVKAEITARYGNGILGIIKFRATSEKPLTVKELGKIQEKLGYHPAGYGIFEISKSESPTICRYIWKCSASCD